MEKNTQALLMPCTLFYWYKRVFFVFVFLVSLISFSQELDVSKNTSSSLKDIHFQGHVSLVSIEHEISTENQTNKVNIPESTSEDSDSNIITHGEVLLVSISYPASLDYNQPKIETHREEEFIVGNKKNNADKVSGCKKQASPIKKQAVCKISSQNEQSGHFENFQKKHAPALYTNNYKIQAYIEHCTMFYTSINVSLYSRAKNINPAIFYSYTSHTTRPPPFYQ